MIIKCACGTFVKIPDNSINYHCNACDKLYTWYKNKFREFEYAELVETPSQPLPKQCSWIGLVNRVKFESKRSWKYGRC